MATSSNHLLIKTLHATCHSFRDICNGPQVERQALKFLSQMFTPHSLLFFFFFFQNFKNIKSIFVHQMKFKRGNDPCRSEPLYKPF